MGIRFGQKRRSLNSDPRGDIMAKIRKRSSAKTVHKGKGIKGKSSSSIRMNAFEVRTNRKKYDVLGQRREKGETGLPGVSRSRALEKVNKCINW